MTWHDFRKTPRLHGEHTPTPSGTWRKSELDVIPNAARARFSCTKCHSVRSDVIPRAQRPAEHRGGFLNAEIIMSARAPDLLAVSH